MTTIYNPLSPPHNHDEVYAKIGEGGGGVTDHGELTGLEDNDHPQYLGVNDPAQDTYKFGGNPPTAYVMTINEQTIDGVKTFGSIPVLPSSNPTAVNQAVRKGYVDSNFVGLTGNQTIAGVKTFSSLPTLPTTAPTANQPIRKGYADATYVGLTGTETIAGVKSFSSIPVLPASNPTTVNQAVRKGYVDEQMKTISAARAAIADQSIPKSSWTQVSLPSSTWDTDGMNSSLNVITIKTAGLYLITGFAQFASGALGFVGSSIFIDGTGVFYYNGAPTSFGTHCPVQGIANLTAGQVISLRVYHEGSTNISLPTIVPAYLRVVRIGAI